MAGQLKRKQIEFNSILKEKDSHIKLVTDIASKSSSVTAQLNVENLKLRRDTKNALQEKDIAQAQALTDIKKQANATCGGNACSSYPSFMCFTEYTFCGQTAHT